MTDKRSPAAKDLTLRLKARRAAYERLRNRPLDLIDVTIREHIIRGEQHL